MRDVLVIAIAALVAACGSKSVEPTAASPGDASEVETTASIPTASPEAASAAKPSAAAPTAADWAVDGAKSTLTFVGAQTGKAFSGNFGNFDAAIKFDPQDLQSSRIEVVVDMTSAKTGDRQRDDALPTADWFAVKEFPKATFASSKIVSAGNGNYEALGKLSIRGVSRDLVLPFTVAIDGDKAVADGSIPLSRPDFGVGQGEFATGQWVGLDVTVTYHIEASR